MSDNPESKEGVAYKLLVQVAANEKRVSAGVIFDADKDWILNTYEECLKAVYTMSD